MTSRKKPGVTFWATVVVVVVLAYPLSLGPADWLLVNHHVPSWAKPAVHAFYAPLMWVVFNGPRPIRTAVLWYDGLWLPDDS